MWCDRRDWKYKYYIWMGHYCGCGCGYQLKESAAGKNVKE